MNEVTVRVVIVVLRALADSYRVPEVAGKAAQEGHVAQQLEALAQLLESAGK